MGLQEDIKEVKSLLKETQDERDKKQKKFRIPFGKKVGKAQKKKNFVTIMKINENGQVGFSKKQIDEQTIIEDGIPRLAGSDYVLFYKNNPMIILPSWSVEPYSPKQQYIDSLTNGSNTKGYSVLMAKMLKETVNPKKTMGGMWKWIIGFGLAAIIVYALLTGGGGV